MTYYDRPGDGFDLDAYPAWCRPKPEPYTPCTSVTLATFSTPKVKEDRVHVYVDEHVRVLYLHGRTAGNWWWRLPDGTWGLDHVRRVPYRLPDLIEGVANGETIYICEGEKDADRLADEYGVKTTSSKDWLEDWSYLFDGARVRIIPDHDVNGMGLRIAKRVQGHLTGSAADVSIVDVSAWPLGWDLSDFLDSTTCPAAAGSTAETNEAGTGCSASFVSGTTTRK